MLEVVVASGVLAGALVALAQLFAMSASTNIAARTLLYTTVLAQQKVEQLRSLVWSVDAGGAPMSDTSTDTAASVEIDGGGTGLSVSPPDTMTSNTSGWVDYLDQFGNVLGGGPIPHPRTAYIRRWSIEPSSANPDNVLVIHVMVTPRRDRGAADARGSTERLPGESRVVSVRTRTAR